MHVSLRFAAFCLLCVFLWASVAPARRPQLNAALSMSTAARQFLDDLTPEQRKVAQLAYELPSRVDWHFIPKASRKGMQFRDLNAGQREKAHRLLASCLSQIGYEKAVKIMALEELLRYLEREKKGTPLRDPERYYFTVFGEPVDSGKWGLSIEGHHLSLNFVVEKGEVISCSPIALCTNPAIVMDSTIDSVPKGTRVLAAEEELAFTLLRSFSEDQKKQAVFASEPLKEVRAAGEAQPPNEKPVGIPFSSLSADQQEQLKKLVAVYTGNLPGDVAELHLRDFQSSDWDRTTFGWAGAAEPGKGHYYRIQSRTFLIELVNTQPDAAGNPANHVHCVWRNMQGDFALPIRQEL